jgi:hypothetical protein
MVPPDEIIIPSQAYNRLKSARQVGETGFLLDLGITIIRRVRARVRVIHPLSPPPLHRAFRIGLGLCGIHTAARIPQTFRLQVHGHRLKSQGHGFAQVFLQEANLHFGRWW